MASFRKDTQTFGPTGADVSVFQVPMIANKMVKLLLRQIRFQSQYKMVATQSQ